MDIDVPPSKDEFEAEQLATQNLFERLLKNSDLSQKIQPDNSNSRAGCQEDMPQSAEDFYNDGIALNRLRLGITPLTHKLSF